MINVEYPCNFILIASMNPCPCGFYGSHSNQCRCSSNAIMRYLSHLSGPILDRIDLQIFLRPVSPHELTGSAGPNHEQAKESSSSMSIQLERFKDENFCTNSRIPASRLEYYCRIGNKERACIEQVMRKFALSARSYGRILKISRTIADLDGDDFISLAHISKALQFRNLDKLLNK